MFPSRLTVTLRPSWPQKSLLVLLHLIAGAALGLSDCPASWHLSGYCILAFSLWFHLRYYQAVMINATPDGGLSIRAQGAWRMTTIKDIGLLHPWIIIRHTLNGRKVENILIGPDTIHPDELRRLHVWLEWRAKVGQADDQSVVQRAS